jgi:hypothetical protein
VTIGAPCFTGDLGRVWDLAWNSFGVVSRQSARGELGSDPHHWFVLGDFLERGLVMEKVEGLFKNLRLSEAEIRGLCIGLRS